MLASVTEVVNAGDHDQAATFERLQCHAQPLVDTVDAVVNRALDALEIEERQREGEVPSAGEHEVDPERLPDLTHTKVLAARLAARDVERPNWNRLLDRVLLLSEGRVTDVDGLRRLCPANTVEGCKTDEAYHYLPEIGISVQGLSANEACAALTATAWGPGVGLDVAFLWRPKEGATHSGERGRLQLPRTPRGRGGGTPETGEADTGNPSEPAGVAT